MTGERKEFMLEASKNQATELEEFIRSLKLPEKTANWVFEMPRRKARTEATSLRGSFFKMLFHYLEQHAQEEGITLQYPARPELFTVQIPLLSELIISVQYLENQVYDGKGGLLKDGILHHRRTSANVQASHLLKDYVYDYIDGIADEGTRLHQRLTHSTRLIFQAVTLGQHWEDEYACFDYLYNGFTDYPTAPDNIESLIDHDLVADLWARFQRWGLPEWQSAYCHFYLRRISLTNATLFAQLAALILELTGYDGKEKERVVKFCRKFSLLHQLCNDVCDVVPASRGHETVQKNANDAYADLRKGCPTLPILFLAREKSESDFVEFQSVIDQDNVQEEIFEILAPVGSQYFIKLIQEGHDDLCKRYLHKNSDKLQESVRLISNNRYYREFWIKHREIKKEKRLIETNLPSSAYFHHEKSTLCCAKEKRT